MQKLNIIEGGECYKMEYKKYQHIEKLGTTEVEGILEGNVFLFYKIDGTNSCIFLKEDNTLGFGSRTRELSLDNDNGGFYANILFDKDEYNKFLRYLQENPNHIIYGEWLIPHTIKRYKADAWKKLYVFDIYDATSNTYISYDRYKNVLAKFGINYIPAITTLVNPTIEDIKKHLDDTGNYLIENGLGEGIVIKNYDYKNKYGRITWAKILTEDFYGNKKELRTKNHINNEMAQVEFSIVKMFLTPEFISKEYVKFKEDKGEFNSRHIFEFLNRTFLEFYKDNWELIFKKFKFPTINFKVLKRLVEDEIKNVLSI